MNSTTTAPKKAEHDKRRRIGFLLIAIGTFLCIFGFLATLFLLQHEVNFNVALYGATGVGGVLLFAGLIAVLE
jgi:hypothetical protein